MEKQPGKLGTYAMYPSSELSTITSTFIPVEYPNHLIFQITYNYKTKKLKNERGFI